MVWKREFGRQVGGGNLPSVWDNATHESRWGHRISLATYIPLPS